VSERGELFSRTVTGATWSGVGRLAAQGIEFVAALVLARLLGPDVFGLVAMILVVVRFADIFADLGMGAALVQRPTVGAGEWRTALALNVGLGAVFAGIAAAAAPLVADLFGRPELTELVRYIAIYFVIRAAALVGQAWLLRRLHLRGLAAAEVAAAILGGAAGIATAVATRSAVAIVVQVLVQAAVVALWLAPVTVRAVRGGRASSAAAGELWRFGRGVTGFSFVNYLARNADDVLIGRYVGASALGLYDRAYSLMLLPIGQITRVLERVMFPALSRLAHDPPRLVSAYVRGAGVVAVVTFPLFAVGAVLADHVVLVLLGPDWVAAGPVFRVLAIAGFWQSVAATTGWLFQATGQTDRMFRWALVSTGVTLVAFVAGLPWGALGVAVAYTIRGAVLMYWSIEVPGRAVGLRFTAFVRALRSTLVASLVAAAASAAALLALRDAAPAVTLVVAAAAGLAGYLAVLAVTRPPAVGELTRAAALVRRRGTS
jgi:O-antigen/teichoic acid export membrane protein